MTKAKLYVQRSQEEEAGSSLEALWSLLAFEFLARAAVAQIHPALLADPDGLHLLYGFGFGNPQTPKSVPAATVFRRCVTVVPGFTEDDKDKAMALLNLRNAELHSGSVALEELATSAWMPEYYRLSKLLLDHLDDELEDFFGPEGGEHARQVIDGLASATEADVKQRIADQRRAFENLAPEDQEKLRRGGTAPEIADLAWMRIVECPACGVRNAIKGEISEFEQPRVGDGEIELSARVLPTGYSCKACRLELRNHGEMLHAGLGDQYAVSDSRDPIEYYGIDPHDLVDPADFYEEEYENE